MEPLVVDITTEDYSVRYDAESATIYLGGRLRLDGLDKYQPVMDVLLKVLEQSPNLTLDLRGLEFLNSSGISMLSMFIVKVRNLKNVNLVLQGSNSILWQTKSLRNLQKLMPTLILNYD